MMYTDDERTVGGFTLDEWQRAFELGGTPRNQAHATAAAMFAHRAAVSEPGTSWTPVLGLEPRMFALLASVGTETAQKVRHILAEYPPGFQREVERQITGESDG